MSERTNVHRTFVVGLVVFAAVALAPLAMPEPLAAPDQPGRLTSSAVQSDGAVLDWDASGTEDVIGYRVYRGSAATPDAELSLIATTDAKVTGYTAANLRSGTEYMFAVAAIDADNAESPRSSTTFATPSDTSDTLAPAAPTSGISLTPFSESRVDLLWAASASTDVAYYEILRSGTVVGTVERPAALRFSDNGLTPGTTYVYTLRSVDSAGNRSPQSTAKSVTTLAAGTVKIVRGPYTMHVTTSSAVVAWYTNILATSSLSVPGATVSADSGVGTLHRMAVSGLSAGTTYGYTAVSGAASMAGSFTTAALPGTPFSFAVIGDFGGGGPGELQNATNIAAFGTNFTQTVGDNVYPSSGYPDPDPATTYSDFDARLFKQLGPAMRNQAFSFQNGNKEYYGGGQFWRAFPLPAPGTGWYSYDWGDAHFLVLDPLRPYAPGTPQYAFAQADLAAHQGSAFRVVFVHNPPYNSVTTSSGSAGIRRDLVPLFEEQRVDLVLSGDTHNYQRSFPMIGGQPVADGGVTYIVSGGGGNGLNSFSSSSPQPVWQAFRQAVYQTLKVSVSPTALVVDAVAAADSSVIDTVTIPRRVPDTTAPTPPTGVTATATSGSTADVSWTTSTDAVGVTGYDVFRGSTLAGSVGAATSFTDSGLSPGTSYSYTVRAKDAAGNVSAPSDAATVTTPAATGGATVTAAAAADARVQQSAPTTNYGTSSTLQVDRATGADVHSYVKFTVSGLDGPLSSAKLRMWTTAGSTSSTSNGPTVHAVADPSWTESALTWSTRPTPTPTPLDDKGALAADALVEYDVGTFVTGNGTFTFALLPDSTDGTAFVSREGANSAKRPQLVVTSAPGDGTDTTPPSTPAGVSATATSSSTVDVSWSESTDAVGVTGYDIYRDSTVVASVGTGTSYMDSTVSPGTTYSYTVRAKDAAGNVSPSSSAAAATTPSTATGRTTTIPALADARVQQSSPTKNYGSANTLQVDLSTTARVESYLKFDVTGLTGSVSSATLRVWTTAGSVSPTPDGPALHAVADSSWTEAGVTWGNRPAASGPPLDDKASLTADVVVEYDVTTAITGDGTFSFVLVPNSADGTAFNSREGVQTSKRPELVIRTS